MKKWVLSVLFTFYSVAALSQSTFYHCTKGGKKIISDQPCQEQGATETKRVNSKDLPPLNTTQGMSQEQRQKTVEGWQNQRLADERQRQQAVSQAARQDQGKQRQCDDLWKEKQSIVAQQRRGNNQWLNDQHRRVNDRMYELKCGM